jgi:acetoin utilization protein AcuB
MLAEELINQMIPVLQPEDPTEKALHWMEELHLPELPVVEHDDYQGFMQRKDILNAHPDANSVADFELAHAHIFALPEQHFYDVLKIAEDNNLQTVAVVNADRQYLGAITISDTLATFAQSYTQQEPGGTVVLSMRERDYSLSEISRLVEANEAKIVSSYVSQHTTGADFIKLTLKINKTDLTRVVATFERFNYKIVAKYQPVTASDTDRDRFDSLMKYLSI